MPLSQYDRLFGGKRGAARKAKQQMAKTYGPEKAERVFYATVNARRGGMQVGLRRKEE